MSDIRAAAERLRKHRRSVQDESPYWVVGSWPVPYMNWARYGDDVATLIEHYLADNLADNDEPADAKWFLTLPDVRICGEAFQFDIGKSRSSGVPLVLEFTDGVACIAEGFCGGRIIVLPGAYTTRRQVRKLLEVLGGGAK